MVRQPWDAEPRLHHGHKAWPHSTLHSLLKGYLPERPASGSFPCSWPLPAYEDKSCGVLWPSWS